MEGNATPKAGEMPTGDVPQSLTPALIRFMQGAKEALPPKQWKLNGSTVEREAISLALAAYNEGRAGTYANLEKFMGTAVSETAVMYGHLFRDYTDAPPIAGLFAQIEQRPFISNLPISFAGAQILEMAMRYLESQTASKYAQAEIPTDPA